jgi:AcrR family transcriptional regulator
MNSPWKKVDDRKKDHAIKREAVLLAAAKAFNESGFHKTSLDDVAARLFVTKPTLYYYVKNKDELLFECVRRGLQMLETAAAQISDPDKTGLEQLISLMRVYAEIVTTDFGKCVILAGDDVLPAASRKKVRAVKAKVDLQFREFIEHGIKDGSIAPCDAKLAAFAVAGALSWIARWHDSAGPLSPEAIATHFIGVLVNGLAPRRDHSETRPLAPRSAKRHETVK